MLKKIVVTSLFMSLMLGSAHVVRAAGTAEPTAMQSPAAKNGEDPAITQRAKKTFADLRSGKIDRTQFSADAANELTPEMVAQVSRMLGELGAVHQFRFVEIQNGEDGAPSSLYVVECKNGKIHYAFGLNAQGKIDVFAFQ